MVSWNLDSTDRGSFESAGFFETPSSVRRGKLKVLSQFVVICSDAAYRDLPLV
jgi:hypothetical protein